MDLLRKSSTFEIWRRRRGRAFAHAPLEKQFAKKQDKSGQGHSARRRKPEQSSRGKPKLPEAPSPA